MSETNQERAIGRLEGQMGEISQGLRGLIASNASFQAQVLTALEEMRQENRAHSQRLQALEDFRLSVEPRLNAYGAWIEQASKMNSMAAAKSGGVVASALVVLAAIAEFFWKKYGGG